MATSSMKQCSPLHHYCLLSLLLLALFPYSTTSSSHAKISYADHCESIVPRSARTGGAVDYSSYISLSNGFFSGGDELLAPENSPPSFPGHFYFYSQNLYPTRTPGVFQLGGSLTLQGPSHASFFTNSSSRWHRVRRNGNVTVYNYRKTVNFDMTGFWSKPSGKICMVGSGYSTTNQGTTLNPTAVFKLNYPQNSDISTSLANGSVESLDTTTSPAHFQPISLLVYAQRNYSYTKIPQARLSCSHVDVPKEVIGFGDGSTSSFSSSSTCNYLQNMLNVWFQLEYEHPCSVLNCTLLGFTPRFMSWNLVECSEDGKVHMYIRFSRDDNYKQRNVMEPEKSLVAEGVWDPEKNRLCVLAFPIMVRKDSVDATIGEATIGISLWFPGVMSIESRSTTVGRIWSERTASGSLRNSKAISFRNFDANYGYLPGIRYEYTRTHDVNKSCGSSTAGNSENGRYPDGNSIGDLRFDISLSNNEGYSAWGSATPLSLGESFYGYSIGSFSQVLVPESASASAIVEESATFEEVNLNPVLWNVSYKLSYRAFNRSSAMEEAVDISAEGIYNAGTGIICMVGCREKNNSNLYKNPNGYSMDCEILISLQLAPMNTGYGIGNGSSYGTIHLNGTIRSTRKKYDDPLYFEPLVLSSNNMYATEATEAVRRMDAEIIMVLVSKTLSCVFIGLQLFHVKKHPEVLPSISIAMLVVLTLGHVIPLVLNFEALFVKNRNRQNVLLWSGGWLEANEVVVRLTTMLAFLLQLRLLQSAWTARSSDDNRKSLGVAERKALRFCLPLYFAGALISWFFHTRSYQKQSDFRDFDAQPNHSIWEDLIAYAGLLLDGFLLPQIILNAIGNCTERALSPLYYVGLTLVRAFPHAYDAYRSRYYMPWLDSSIIFATSHEDFYSYAWDIIILFGGVLFAVLIFFQQKFGGSCFLPKRFRSAAGGYELVSVATT